LDTTACYSYISPSGKYTWKEEGDYMDTILNTNGCDSIISIHLAIKRVNTNIVETNWGLMVAFSGGEYKWFECGNNTLLDGQSDQSLATNIPGTYAAIITDHGCADTSACFTILPTDIADEPISKVKLYPNPTHGIFSIDLGKEYPKTLVTISNPGGKKILQKEFYNTDKIKISEALSPGLYFVTVNTGDREVFLKLVTSEE
jgi:hypothetical protein